MYTFRITFYFNSRKYQEDVRCYTRTDARSLITSKYPGCRISDVVQL